MFIDFVATVLGRKLKIEATVWSDSLVLNQKLIRFLFKELYGNSHPSNEDYYVNFNDSGKRNQSTNKEYLNKIRN